MCSYCCSTEPGYVFLSEKDLERLCECFGLERDEFIATYCRLVDYGEYSLVSLTERKNYDCIFLTKDGCSVYEARPLQCRTYPFWKSVLASRENWESEAKWCRGINHGRKVSSSEIEDILRKSEENPPLMIFRKSTDKKNKYL